MSWGPHLHLTWCWSTPASCYTVLSGLSLGQQAILLWASVLDSAIIPQKPNNWCCLTVIMRMSQLRRTTRGWGEPEQDVRTSNWRPTHHSHAEQQSWGIPRTKVSSPASCVDIPYRITCSSLTNLNVSSAMRRRTSRCLATCSRSQLAVHKRVGSFVTTLTCSSCSSTGHRLRLIGRTSSWRSGRHGDWHTRNCGQVGGQEWPAARHARHFRRCHRLLPLRQGKEKKLPPTDNNLQLPVLRANLQMIRWKTADHRHPPVDARDIRRFGWDVKEGRVVTPSVSNAPVAPQWLLHVVSCSCSTERKACSLKRCSCRSAGLSCMEYCYWEGEMRAAVPSS